MGTTGNPGGDANGSNSSDGSNETPEESMPASEDDAVAEGSADAVDGIAQESALDAVRPPSWSMGGASIAVVGVGVVAVALGALAAAVSIRRDQVPVGMEGDLLLE